MLGQISLIMADKFVQKEELLKVSKAVLRSQDIRELSWDPTKKRYTMDELEAAKQAVDDAGLDDFWIHVIGYWDTFIWNDVQYWARAHIES